MGRRTTTERRLHEVGIHTIGQLAQTGSPILGRLLGQSAGTKRPLSPRTSMGDGARHGPGRNPWAPRPRSDGGGDPELIRETLGYLADRVAGRLRKANLAGRTVTVRVRFSSCVQ